MKTRVHYGEQVLNGLSAGLRNRDEKIDIREVYLQLDNIVNQLAKEGFLENWKMGFGGVDDQWLTRWEWLTVTDPADEGNSYFSIPANYVPLPKNQGINEIYFKNDFDTVTKKYFNAVHVISQKDYITYRNNPAGSLQGRLAVFPQNGKFIFNQPNIASIYGDVGVALVIKNSFDISDSAPYPIPADIENRLIQECIQFFLQRRAIPTDTIRDRNDKP